MMASNGNGNGKTSQSYRTLSLVILVMAGAGLLAYFTEKSELVYAYGIVSTAALGWWISGKGFASYTDVLQTRAQVAYPPAQVAGTTTQRTETADKVVTETQTAQQQKGG